MKHVKKLMAVVLSAALAMSMCVCAFAATASSPNANVNEKDNTSDTYSLGMSSIADGEEFTVYQVMVATAAPKVTKDGVNKYNYRITEKFVGAFTNGEIKVSVVENGTPVEKTFYLNGQNEICEKKTVNEVETLVPITDDGEWTNTNSTAAAALASALTKYAQTTANEVPVAATLNNRKLSETLSAGLYVIAQTKAENETGNTTGTNSNKEVASKPILVNLNKDKTSITTKKDYVSLDKEIEETASDPTTDTKKNNVNIGDTVNYRVEATFPTYEAGIDKKLDTDSLVFTLTDTLSNGLDLNYTVAENATADEKKDALLEAITFGAPKNATTPVTLKNDAVKSITYENHVLTISFTKAAILANQGKTFAVRYSATLNEDALVNNINGNPNKVMLDYSNNPNKAGEHKYLHSDTNTFTYGFQLKKVDGKDNSDLPNAVFEIKDSDDSIVKFKYDKDTNTYTVVDNSTTVTSEEDLYEKNSETGEFVLDELGQKVVKDGSIVDEVISTKGTAPTIKGLDAGSYTLTETQAPDKYTKLAESITVTIKDGGNGTLPSGTATISVSGKSGNPKMVNGETGEETGAVELSEGDNGQTTQIDLKIWVENLEGATLPETGARTAMYCMIGGAAIIVLGAGYYLIGARRNKKEQ